MYYAISNLSNNRVKLADFGMAGFGVKVNADDGEAIYLKNSKKCSNNSSLLRLYGRCGTPGYVAPDILKAKTGESYSLNVDMFSIGVIAYILLTGEEPFYAETIQDVLNNNKNCAISHDTLTWSGISDDAKDFVSKALASEEFQRLTPSEAKSHHWTSKFFSAYKHQKTKSLQQNVTDNIGNKGTGREVCIIS